MPENYSRAALELAKLFAEKRGEAVAYKQYFSVGEEWFSVSVARCEEHPASSRPQLADIPGAAHV